MAVRQLQSPGLRPEGRAMLLESETDLRLLLGTAAAIFLLLALVGFALLVRASASLREAQHSLAKTETGADRTERRMFQILQAIPVALVETDMSGKFTFANRAAHQLLGRKDAELLGLRFHSATWGITYPDGRLIPPDLLPAARALRGQTVKGFQHLIINPNTRKKMLVSVTAMPILNEMGEVIGSSSAIVETESLTHAQPALEEELKPRYFDIASALLVALDPDGRVRDINAHGAAILGRTVDEVIGRDWIGEFLPAERQQEARADFAAVIAGRADMPDQAEGWLVRADGQQRLVLWRGSVMRDERDKIVATLSSGLDITDLRAAEAAAYAHADVAREAAAALAQAEAAIRRGEGELRSLVEALPQLVWTCDAQGQFDYLSPSWTAVTGVAAEALMGQGWLEVVHPEDRAATQASWAAAIEGSADFDVSHRLRTQAGDYRWYKARAARARDQQGAIVRWAGASLDITRLMDSQEALERRLAERAAEVDAANDQRRRTEEALAQAQRLETVGRLTGGVAHDFNNLLTVVIGALDMILRHADNSDRVRRLGEAALTASKRGEKLTRQLLAFSRRHEFRLETLEIATLVRGLEPLLRRSLEDGVALSVEAEPDCGFAELDAVQLESALLNLVINARDALEGGQGRIDVRSERTTLAVDEISDTAPGDYVRISVTDTGSGMSSDVAARAFEPFFTTREIGKGAGLGLAQVYGFARQSAGGVQIASKPGEGATVSIYLPLKALAAEPVGGALGEGEAGGESSGEAQADPDQVA